jgi:hypothetical protein
MALTAPVALAFAADDVTQVSTDNRISPHDQRQAVQAVAKPVGRYAERLAAQRERRQAEQHVESVPGGPSAETLASIRECESGGNYQDDTGNGFYGAYQFMQGTWEAVGGKGSPAEASPAEQDYRAALLYARSGAGQWPVCGA